MSERRDALERHFEQEENRYAAARDAGRMSEAEYREAMQDLQREAQQAARDAMEDDFREVRDEWGFQ